MSSSALQRVSGLSEAMELLLIVGGSWSSGMQWESEMVVMSCSSDPITVSQKVQSSGVYLILTDASLHFHPKITAVLFRCLARCMFTGCMGSTIPAFLPQAG